MATAGKQKVRYGALPAAATQEIRNELLRRFHDEGAAGLAVKEHRRYSVRFLAQLFNAAPSTVTRGIGQARVLREQAEPIDDPKRTQ